MRSIQGIRDRCRAANDVNWYDRQFALQIYLAGYVDYLTSKGGATSVRGNVPATACEPPDYPLLDPGEGADGVQNHGLVNARINVQGVVMSKPKVNFKLQDVTERQVNEEFFADRWEYNNWGEVFYNAGMEVETNGIGWSVCGIGDEGMVDWDHVSVLDMLWDRAYKTSGKWRFICYRMRMPIDDAFEMFGHVFNQDFATKGAKSRMRAAERYGIPIDSNNMPIEKLSEDQVYEQIKALCVKRVAPMSGSALAPSSTTNIEDYILHVWFYWDRDHHVVFLNSIDGPKSIPLAYLPIAGENSAYNYQRSDEAGMNPYGRIPAASWIDSWSPGILRPTSKSETVSKLVKMLNTIENFMGRVIKDGIPINVVDGTKCPPEMLEALKRCKTASDIEGFLVNEVGGSIDDFIQRTETAQLADAWITLRSILKEEINAATGVQDMQRGQALSGERTRYEVQQLMDSAGVQARHLRNQYAQFIIDVVACTRAVAAIGDRVPTMLYLDDGPIPVNGKGFPMKPFLKDRVPVMIDPNQLLYQPDSEIKADAVAELTEVLIPGIQAGVVHPYRAFAWCLKKGFNHRDPTVVMMTPQELQAQQQAKAQAAQAQAEAEAAKHQKPAQEPADVSESMNYKDAPDDIKRQMEEREGYKPSTSPKVNSSLPPKAPPAATTKVNKAKPKAKAA